MIPGYDTQMCNDWFGASGVVWESGGRYNTLFYHFTATVNESLSFERRVWACDE